MVSGDDDWSKWAYHVLAELKRLEARLDAIDKRAQNNLVKIEVLQARAAILAVGISTVVGVAVKFLVP